MTILQRSSGPLARIEGVAGGGPAVIEVHGLRRSYGRGRIQAVRDVSFAVARGEVFGLIGPDGAGKTGMTSQTYVVAMKNPSDATFAFNETYRLTVVFDAAGVPQTGQAAANTPDTTFYLGMAVRLFETAGTTYTFYTNGDAVDPVTRVNDGGLFYNNDKTMAGHQIVGFQRDPVIGQAVQQERNRGRARRVVGRVEARAADNHIGAAATVQ